MHINHRYLLWTAERHAPQGRFLDYGCGNGEAVREAFEQGVDVWGCDTFTLNTDPQYPRIKPMYDGLIPYPDQSFDVVFSNMVMEHVFDMPRVLSEIRRVLKPEGLTVHVFVTRESWREGHSFVPFAHRITRRWWLEMAYAVGLGNERWRPDWVQYWDNYLGTACCYRTGPEVRRIFRAVGLRVRDGESEYLGYRLGAKLPFATSLLRRAGLAVMAATL